MTDTVQPIRPVPRWLHYWAVATAIATLVLLAIGQMVTSYQAGMANPIWPTEPWYLFVIGWQEPSRGYLIEHTHRIVAFTVGGLVSVLALGLWWTDPRRGTKWAGLAAICVLLAGFGQFHGGLIAQRNVPPAQVRIPLGGVVVTLLGLVAIIGLAVAGAVRRSHASGLRLLGVAALVGVMIQGLLGGFRVMLNALVGTDLAMFHGIFAQVVLCILVALAVLTARRPAIEIPRHQAASLSRWSAVLVALVFVQIVWGALVRHAPTPLTQRLHFLTSFLATALIVWLLMAVFAQPAARARVRLAGWMLGGLLALQLALGVESWMAKFGTYTLPSLVQITTRDVVLRTSHALVGSGILATSVIIAIRLRQTVASTVPTSNSVNTGWYEPPTDTTRAVAVGTRIRGDGT